MNVLALDPSTHCGFAHSSGPSGTFDLSIRRDESGGMRLIRLRGKLNEIRASCGVDIIIFESAVSYGAHKSGIGFSFEVQAVIKLWCEDNGVEYRGYSPSEIKKHATGRGNANKKDMMEAATARWPAVKDDNEADALWLLDLAACIGIWSRK